MTSRRQQNDTQSSEQIYASQQAQFNSKQQSTRSLRYELQQAKLRDSNISLKEELRRLKSELETYRRLTFTQGLPSPTKAENRNKVFCSKGRR